MCCLIKQMALACGKLRVPGAGARTLAAYLLAHGRLIREMRERAPQALHASPNSKLLAAACTGPARLRAHRRGVLKAGPSPACLSSYTE